MSEALRQLHNRPVALPARHKQQDDGLLRRTHHEPLGGRDALGVTRKLLAKFQERGRAVSGWSAPLQHCTGRDQAKRRSTFARVLIARAVIYGCDIGGPIGPEQQSAPMAYIVTLAALMHAYGLFAQPYARLGQIIEVLLHVCPPASLRARQQAAPHHGQVDALRSWRQSG